MPLRLISKIQDLIHQLKSIEKQKYYSFFNWTILLFAFTYLAYKLYTFNQYKELINEWQKIPLEQFIWLGMVFILLPANWYFESIKWKKIVSRTQYISVFQSFKAVMSGFSTGFFTPNRTGDFIGRLAFLKSENRKTGITLSLINSLSQNIIIALCGIPASIFFFIIKTQGINNELKIYFISLVVIIVLVILFLFLLPQIVSSKTAQYFNKFTSGLHLYTFTDLLQILFYSLLRFIVFCIQFYAMLHFFGVQIEWWEAFIAIPANYLFVTFTPSFAFSELAIRSSYAVFFIGAFSTNVLNIALAGAIIWVFNFVIPMLIGSTLLVKSTNVKD